jgi:hypothetical protein
MTLLRAPSPPFPPPHLLLFILKDIHYCGKFSADACRNTYMHISHKEFFFFSRDVRGSNGSAGKDLGLLGRYAVSTGTWLPTFRREHIPFFFRVKTPATRYDY